MFRKLTENVYASPQIGLDEVTRAAEEGFSLIINNRPEDESPDQVPGDAIASAAKAAGLDYIAIPVTHAGFSEPQVRAMAEALAGDGKVLAYCRSGTRSTLLWALAEASRGASLEGLAQAAQQAGYDIAPVRAIAEVLASRPR